MRRFTLPVIVALGMLAAPAIARGDASCNAAAASDLAQQGYSALDAQRWQDARTAAGQLALYAKNCDDPKVGYPSVVYSAYIGSAAFHGLGNDQKAAQALQMGMIIINALKKEGGYANLVDAMEPKFASLAHELKP